MICQIKKLKSLKEINESDDKQGDIMGDGLTDRRSQSEYWCEVCKKQFYFEDMAFTSKTHTICRNCQSKIEQHNTTTKGMKFDDNKLQFGLLPPEIKLYFAEVLTFGAQKYAPDNWKKVDVKRYYDALERHMNAFQLGEELDSDSGLHHLKHALTNMMFICYLELNKKE